MPELQGVSLLMNSYCLAVVDRVVAHIAFVEPDEIYTSPDISHAILTIVYPVIYE
jgi:hypothetical protein